MLRPDGGRRISWAARPPARTPTVSASATSDTTSLTRLLDALKAESGEKVTLGDLLDKLEARSTGPLLLVPSFIALSPVGMIPGMSIATGTIIFLIAAQIFVTGGRPWLPQRALEISIDRDLLNRSIDKARPWTRRVDRVFHERLTVLTRRPLIYLLALVYMAMAALMFPLAVVPFGVAAPSSACVFFSLGLTMRDGLMVAIGLALAGGTVGLGVYLL